MEKDVRTTLYISEELSKRFRESCNKKFGDKQGKIKQGYVLAITNFCDQVEQDGKPIPKPPSLSTVLAKELSEQKPKVKVDQQGTVSFTEDNQEPVELDQVSFGEKLAQAERLTKEEVEAKAKKLAEARKKVSSDHKIIQ